MARQRQTGRTGHTVLVVDDHDEALDSLCRLLEREGHRVVTAPSPERALAQLRAADVHLLIIDPCMARMAGERLMRQVRRVDPMLPIILHGTCEEVEATRLRGNFGARAHHDRANGAEALLSWVEAGLRAYRSSMARRPTAAAAFRPELVPAAPAASARRRPVEAWCEPGRAGAFFRPWREASADDRPASGYNQSRTIAPPAPIKTTMSGFTGPVATGDDTSRPGARRTRGV